jgi:hypothetical protein
MKIILDENKINLLELFIHNNLPVLLPLISYSDIKNAKKYYNLINLDEPTSYYIFASSGYTTYGYYKSKNNIIYVITIYFQDINAYSDFDSSWYLLK